MANPLTNQQKINSLYLALHGINRVMNLGDEADDDRLQEAASHLQTRIQELQLVERQNLIKKV